MCACACVRMCACVCVRECVFANVCVRMYVRVSFAPRAPTAHVDSNEEPWRNSPLFASACKRTPHMHTYTFAQTRAIAHTRTHNIT